MSNLSNSIFFQIKREGAFTLLNAVERQFRQKRNYLTGFTIIETIITISTLFLALIAILQMLPFGIRTARSAEMATVAINLGQAKLEEMAAKPYDKLPLGVIEAKHQLDTPFEKYYRETTISCVNPDLQPVDCDYDLEANPGPLKKIIVVVFWQPPFSVGDKSIDVINLVAKKDE